MIVIEGGDAVGKTTLARYLVELLNGIHNKPHVYRHLGKLADTFDQYWDYLPLMHRFSVQDRLYASRCIYGSVAHNQRALTPEEYRLLDAHARTLGTVHVFLTADEELIRERCATEAERADTTHRGLYDADTVLRVNDWLYRSLTQGWDGNGLREHWHADVDYHFHMTKEDPFARRHADVILAKYFERQKALEEVLCRKH